VNLQQRGNLKNCTVTRNLILKSVQATRRMWNVLAVEDS
jgi:hypothetical protein